MNRFRRDRYLREKNSGAGAGAIQRWRAWALRRWLLLLAVAIGSPIAAFRINQARKAEAAQREMVEAGARALRKSLYLADMGMVQQALQENNLGRAASLIEKYFPKPGEEDLRGLEWRYLWQLRQGNETFTLHFNDHGVNNEYAVSAVTFSPDGRLVALASFDNKVTILDAATKRVVTRLNGYFPGVNPQTLTFSPDGKLLAAADKGAVSLWRTNDWHLSHRLESKVGNYVIAMAFSPDGQTLASSFNFNVSFWDVTTGREKQPAHARSPALVRGHLLAFSPDGQTLAVAIDNEIQLWNTQMRSRIGNFTGKMNSMASLAWSRRWLAAGNWRGDLKIWDLETSQEVNIKAHPTFLFALTFSPDGNTLVTGGGDQKIYFWDVASLKPQGSGSATPQSSSGLRKIATRQGHLHEVWAVAFSPDGKTLVSGGKDGTARFWSGVSKADESLLPEARLALRFSDDGSRLLTMNRDWTLSGWDIRSRHKLRTIDLGLSTNATPVALSSNGETLAVGRMNGTVELWNLETRQRISIHRIARGEIQILKFSPKDRLLLANSGRRVDGEWKSSVTVLNLGTGQPLSEFDGGTWGRAFSPDETLLASSMDDYSITVRNLATRGELTRLKVHTWDVTVMAFSPDGKRLASASGDNTVRLWSTTSWKELDLLRGHMGGVNALVFSIDGKFLASGSRDNTLKLWDVTSVPAQELLNIRTTPHNPTSVLFSPDNSVLAVSGNSDITGRNEVLLLLAPSFAEIGFREMAKRRERANVNTKDY